VLLHRYSGGEDIIVGNRIANRPHTDLQYMVGKFSSEVPFRARPRPHQTVREFLGHIKDVALGAFKHQEYPVSSWKSAFTREPRRAAGISRFMTAARFITLFLSIIIRLPRRRGAAVYRCLITGTGE